MIASFPTVQLRLYETFRQIADILQFTQNLDFFRAQKTKIPVGILDFFSFSTVFDTGFILRLRTYNLTCGSTEVCHQLILQKRCIHSSEDEKTGSKGDKFRIFPFFEFFSSRIFFSEFSRRFLCLPNRYLFSRKVYFCDFSGMVAPSPSEQILQQ